MLETNGDNHYKDDDNKDTCLKINVILVKVLVS